MCTLNAWERTWSVKYNSCNTMVNSYRFSFFSVVIVYFFPTCFCSMYHIYSASFANDWVTVCANQHWCCNTNCNSHWIHEAVQLHRKPNFRSTDFMSNIINPSRWDFALLANIFTWFHFSVILLTCLLLYYILIVTLAFVFFLLFFQVLFFHNMCTMLGL